MAKAQTSKVRPTSDQNIAPSEEFAGARLPPQEEAKRSEEVRQLRESDKAATDAALAAMAESEERATESLLRAINTNTWFDSQVDAARKGGRNVLVDKSSQMWVWKDGPARFKVEGLKRLTWVDPADGQEKSNVLVLARVLDGEGRAAKQHVGKSVLVPMVYTVASVLVRGAGGKVDRENPPSKFFDKLEREGREVEFVSRVETFIAFVECGVDGMPLYVNIRGGRRFCQQAMAAVL